MLFSKRVVAKVGLRQMEIVSGISPDKPWIAVCSCGARTPICQTQAGERIECRCGLPMDIPSLGTLRTIAGLNRYESGIIDTINRMIDDGQLPTEDKCIFSGKPTTDILLLYFQCETVTRKGLNSAETLSSRIGSGILFALTKVGGISGLYKSIKSSYPERWESEESFEQVGNNRGVQLPLRVQKDFHAELLSLPRRQQLLEYLKSIPVYARLFEIYPHGFFR